MKEQSTDEGTNGTLDEVLSLVTPQGATMISAAWEIFIFMSLRYDCTL